MAEEKSLPCQYLNKMFVPRDHIKICSVRLVIVILENSQHAMVLISQSDVIITPHLVNATPKVSFMIHHTIYKITI